MRLDEGKNGFTYRVMNGDGTVQGMFYMMMIYVWWVTVLKICKGIWNESE